MTTEHDPLDRTQAFANLYLEAACGLAATTTDGVILYLNQTLADWTGFSRDQLAGLTFEDLLDTGSRLFFETRYAPVLRLSGEVREVSLSLKRADGSSLPVLVNARSRTEADATTTIHLAIFDATERTGYEQQLLVARRSAESSARKLKSLQDASTAFARCETEEAVEDALVDITGDAFLASSVAVLRVSEEGELTLSAGHHPWIEALVASSGRPERRALERGETIVITAQDENDAQAVDDLKTARMAAMSATPLFDPHGGPRRVVVSFFARRREFEPAFFELQSALARQAIEVFQRVRLQQQLALLAAHDQLTGLANRTQLQERLALALKRSQTSNLPLGVIFIDLDGFKRINDELGHASGDAVLRSIATRLTSVMRSSDTVARFGGDEFVIVCENVDEAIVSTIAEKLRDAIAQPFGGALARYRVTASLGVSVVHPEVNAGVTADDIISRADDAMYASKNAGKDTVTVL